MADWTTIQLNLRYHWKTAFLWVIGVGGALALLLCTHERAEAWVQGYQPFPEGEATVVTTPFCRSGACSYYLSQTRWGADIQAALSQWNNAGSGFVFRTRTTSRTTDPCRAQGEVVIIIADPSQLCPGDGPLRQDARTEYGPGWARIYLSTGAESVQGGHPGRLLLHELGHVVGLGHPDDAGQRVQAVMNSVISSNVLQQDDIEGIRVLYGTHPGTADDVLPDDYIRLEAMTSDSSIILRWTDDYGPSDPDRPTYAIEISRDGISWRIDLPNVGQPFHYTGLRNGTVYYFRIVADFDGTRGVPSNAVRVVVGQSVDEIPQEPVDSDLLGFLENPRNGSSRSGVGIISGWVCEATEVQILITREDGQVIQQEAAYGTERTDTRLDCGDTDNGFGLLFNWNLLGEGVHEIIAEVDGRELDRATITVTTLDGEFPKGLSGRYVLENFPYLGQSVVIEWEQSLQNFVITELE